MILFESVAPRDAVATETITLPFDTRCKTRLRARLSGGEDCGIFLPRGTVLRGGDKLRTADGRTANERHGGWPFQSWGPEKQKDLWWQVDFGRDVEVDRVTLYLRADFPHDKHWHHATLVFSDGQRQPVALAKTGQPQTITFSAHKTRSLRLTDLVSDEPPGWCALAEFEAWGRDPVPIVEDLETVGVRATPQRAYVP